MAKQVQAHQYLTRLPPQLIKRLNTMKDARKNRCITSMLLFCSDVQAKIDQRKATRQKHLTSWLQAIESKSNSLYCIDIFDGVTKDRGITLEGYKICVHSHCIQDKSGKGRVEILTTSYTKVSYTWSSWSQVTFNFNHLSQTGQV